MDALQASKLRLAIVLLMVTALVLTGVGVPTRDGFLASQAWAGVSGDGQHDDNDDDDDDDGNHNGHKKGFDHFACYTAGSHQVNKDVNIINQFTKDANGNIVQVPITVGELTLLCVPTKKILIDDTTKPIKKATKKTTNKPIKKPRP